MVKNILLINDPKCRKVKYNKKKCNKAKYNKKKYYGKNIV